MKFAYDVPGYLCGHRFSQDRRYYDATANRFYDLAGYNRFRSYAEVTVGTPAFSTHGTNAREGLLLDNSCQLQFVNPCPWEGTMIYVIKPTLPAGTTFLRPWHFGDAASSTSNGLIGFNSTLTANQIVAAGSTPAVSAAWPTITIPSANGLLMVLMWAWDQETRILYNSRDAVTVTTSSAASGTTNGNALSMGWNGNVGLTGSVGSRMVRLGNNTGTIGNVTPDATNYCHVFEQHFFKGNVLRNNLAEVKEFVDTLKAYYGVTV
jgi:hypothetical protein